MTDTAATAESTPVLEMRNVSKTFPGVKALNQVELRAWSGEVLALMGRTAPARAR
jgi:ribose transport system ATP-binding protein